MKDAPSTGRFSRSAIGSVALAQASISHIGHKARQFLRDDEAQIAAQAAHEEALGRLLFQTLNRLKGTALKLSQILSMEANFLPDSIRRELAKACYQVTPLNRALIHKVFVQELGDAPENLFAQFTPQAFAAASLGQVHHALTHDGNALAVKVQYPGIAASVRSDMAMLRTVLLTLAQGSDYLPRKEIISTVLQQIEDKLGEELDYFHEARQLTWFAEEIRRLSINNIRIPKLHHAYSTERILCMEKLDGVHLDVWLLTQPTQVERDHYGQLLHDWFWQSVKQLGRVHADPHPGNFLFMPNGQLGILDFGCTKTISPVFKQALSSAWSALLAPQTDMRYTQVRAAYIAMGLIDETLNEEEFAEHLMPAVLPFANWQLEPYRHANFDFTHKSPYPKLERSDSKTLRRVTTGFHEDLPYFDRAFMGLMHMLTKIGARVVTGNPWLE